METIKDFFEQKLFPENEIGDGQKIYSDGDLSTSSPSTPLAEVREESEKIREWRKQRENLLSNKDKQEEKQKKEWLKSGKAELEAWHKQNTELLKKIKQSNRDSVEPDNPVDETDQNQKWEKICSYCDFSPTFVEGLGGKSKTRMVAVLLRLKGPSPSS